MITVQPQGDSVDVQGWEKLQKELLNLGIVKGGKAL